MSWSQLMGPDIDTDPAKHRDAYPRVFVMPRSIKILPASGWGRVRRGGRGRRHGHTVVAGVALDNRLPAASGHRPTWVARHTRPADGTFATKPAQTAASEAL